PLLGVTDGLAGVGDALGRVLARLAGLLVRLGQSLLSIDHPLVGGLDLLLRRDNPVVALYTLGLLLVQTLLLGLQLLDAELGALVGDAGALDLIGVAALAGCCQVGFGLLQVESRRPLIQRVAAQRPGDILQMLDRVRA